MGISTQTAFTNNISAWRTDVTDTSNDWTAFQLSIKNIMAETGPDGKPNTDAQFLAISMALEGATQCQGDKVGVAAGLMNIGSAGSAIVTEITQMISAIPSSGGCTCDAATLVKDVQFLESQMEADKALPANQQWSGAGTQSSVIQACQGILSELGVTAGETPSEAAASVNVMINSWTENPNTVAANGQTGEQNLQTLNGSNSTLNNSFGGYSQMENNAMSYATGIESTEVGVERSVFSALTAESKALTANQRAS